VSGIVQTHLVLGATGGIGSALARYLSGQGARVALAARDPERLSALAAETGGVPVPGLEADSFDSIDAAFDAALESFGRLDGVVNCVGSLLLKPAHITSEAEWHGTIADNLTSSFATVRAAGRRMARQENASVVLVSSAAARMGLANHDAIAAAKAGIEGLTRSAAATYGKAGIRVNAVAPGLVETPLSARIRANERARQHSLSLHALGRFGTADDLVSAIAWLLGPTASWVTGQVVGVDGGLGSVRAG
jgi:NAD(P)-dependent dehydrogenase (short-subunit alcohol dehydrogenase family)